MMAYANPEDPQDELKRSDGFGVARFDKSSRTITFECWPRFASVDDGEAAQFPGWPITVNMADNDGRQPIGRLQTIKVTGIERPVVQVITAETGQVQYSMRMDSAEFQLPVYEPGTWRVKIYNDRPDNAVELNELVAQDDLPAIEVRFE